MKRRSTRRWHLTRADWIVAAALSVATVAVLSAFSFGGFTSGADGVAHAAIANAWVHGAGFVDPVHWTFSIDQGPPSPGGAVRPVLQTVLVAIPLALGASLESLSLIHSIFAGLSIGAICLLLRSFMGLAAAVAVSLLCASNTYWFFSAFTVVTEVAGVLLFVAVIVASPRAVVSLRGAILCALITFVAWLARPNLGALVLAVAVAGAVDLGPRGAIRSRPLWAYVLLFFGLVVGVQTFARWQTGLAIGDGYNFELINGNGVEDYGMASVGLKAFIADNRERLLAVLEWRVSQVATSLASLASFQAAGWFGLVAVPVALLQRAPHRVPLRVSALAALGFSLLTVLNYAAFTERYLLFPAIAIWICLMPMISEAAERLSGRLRSAGVAPVWSSVAAATPVLLVLALSLPRLPTIVGWITHPDYAWGTQKDPLANRNGVRTLCRYIDRDAVVVGPSPYRITMECGNAALALPQNIDRAEIRRRFFEERRPAFVLAPVGATLPWLRDHRAFRRVRSAGGLSLYERREEMHHEPWRAPPPLVCVGLGGEAEARCLAERGRSARQEPE